MFVLIDFKYFKFQVNNLKTKYFYKNWQRFVILFAQRTILQYWLSHLPFKLMENSIFKKTVLAIDCVVFRQ